MSMTVEDLDYLRRFARTPEGRYFLQLLDTRLRSRDEKLRTATGEELYRQQGRAQELCELIKDITGADTRLKQLGQPPRKARVATDQMLS